MLKKTYKKYEKLLKFYHTFKPEIILFKFLNKYNPDLSEKLKQIQKKYFGNLRNNNYFIQLFLKSLGLFIIII